MFIPSQRVSPSLSSVIACFTRRLSQSQSKSQSQSLHLPLPLSHPLSLSLSRPLSPSLSLSSSRLFSSLSSSSPLFSSLFSSTSLFSSLLSLSSFTLSPSHSHSSPLSSFFWTRNEGPRTGSRQRHHSSAVRITVIIFTTMTKLNEDREKGDTSSWPTVEQDKRSKLSQSNGQTPLTSCILFRPRASCYCACHPHHWGHRGTSTSVPSVSKTPVHHRRQPSTPSIDATIRSHFRRQPPKPSIDATIQSTLTTHQLTEASFGSSTTNQIREPINSFFILTTPTRLILLDPAVNPGLFRRRAQPIFHGPESQHLVTQFSPS